MANLPSDASLATVAMATLQDRRQRDRLFADHVDGFGEPAWDMLLALFIAHAEGRRWVQYDSLVAALPVPANIAKPYITWLWTQDLATLRDGKAALAPRGHELMAQYLNRGAAHG